MTGTCKLCLELITGAPVLEVGEDRAKAEFIAFSESMRKHVGARHLDSVQMFAGILTLAAGYFSALFADCPTEDFEAGKAATRDVLCAAVQGAQLVVDQGAPVDRPLVVPGVS